MALSLNLGSAFESAAPVDLLPWSDGSLQVTQDDGSLVKASDIESPLDKQASVKITNTRIANVYNTLAKGSIPVGSQAVNASGQSLFVELNATASKTVGSDEILLPMVARVEVRLPNDGDLTDSDVESLILAALAVFYDSTGDIRATTMMRGVLLPS